MKPMLGYLAVLCLLTSVPSIAQPPYPNRPVEDEGHEQSECSITLHPLDKRIQFVMWNDFRENLVKPGYAYTTDFGDNWTKRVLDIGDLRGFDPSGAIDRSGTYYYCYATVDAQSRWDILVSKTATPADNDWEDVVLSDPSGFNLNDKPFMAIDNRGQQDPGNLYASWISANNIYFSTSQVWFSRSTDGGDTWESISQPLDSESRSAYGEPNRTTYPEVSEETNEDGDKEFTVTEYLHYPMPAVAPNGDVYVVWAHLYDELDGGPIINGSRSKIGKSTDGGASFGSIVDLHSFTYVTGQSISSDPPNRGIRILNIPSMAIDQNTGAIFVVYKDIASASPKNFAPRIKFTKSTDEGQNWSTPTIIGEIGSPPNANAWYFFPAIAIDEGSKITVAYMYSDAGTPRYVDCYIVESTDQGSSFSAAKRISSESSTPTHTLNAHEYNGLAVTVGFQFPVWTDYRSNNQDGNFDIYWSNTNPPPAPPQSVQVAATSPNQYGYRYPKVTWSANSEPDLDGYEIWRKIVSAMDCGNGSWYLLSDTLGPSTQEYIDASIPTAGTGQCTAVYKLRARDEANNFSGYSNEASIQFGNDMWKANSTGRSVPTEYELHSAYPNPFNPSTLIQFALPENSSVTLDVFDVLGRKVAEIVNHNYAAGYHSTTWNAANVASGVYFLRFAASDGNGTVKFSKMSKLVLTK